ncbi:MAG: T9SS C-terminal target domain-containing protein [Chlorobi bacterium]|nr:MAG: T9SS type A sorting domain-containing protein [Bacteroidota bacterium]MBE2265695.1 T9SS type A sorting domain-containing protein [Flavobacteriales bacterium]MBL1160876.1 T9SS C-terminal target domain-containing protein [Chlorobiota bacterium]MBW7852837.1 T9SS type A sorting domain-containing protein [Candidatus Kapabacteria bacterium]MCC6330932.1 T9SS type A sorting domain-containing protein [Ignavibacteria bacterium]
MKILLKMLLVAVFMATGSTIRAKDTLIVTSHRIVDVCSGEKRWLISASLGSIYDSDSLMSFDITIGFDTSLITPTDGLTSGTLAEQMKFSDISPAFNFRVPGEMRVSAFTITRNVKGNLPLFAVAGNYNGGCGTEVPLTLPWEPEFNEEFKRVVTAFIADTLKTVAIPKVNSTTGIVTHSDTISLADTTDLVEIEALVTMQSTDSKLVKLHIESDRLNLVTIDSVSFAGTAYSAIDTVATDHVTIKFQTTGSETPGTVYIRFPGTAADTVAIRYRTEIVDSCTCTQPGKTAITNIIKREPVGIQENKLDRNEGSVIQWSVHRDIITIQNLHGGPNAIRIVDTFGRIITSQTVSTDRITIPLNQMAHGLYFVTITNNKRVQSIPIYF